MAILTFFRMNSAVKVIKSLAEIPLNPVSNSDRVQLSWTDSSGGVVSLNWQDLEVIEMDIYEIPLSLAKGVIVRLICRI